MHVFLLHGNASRRTTSRSGTEAPRLQWAAFAGTRIGFAFMTDSARPVKLTSRLLGTRLLAQFLGMTAIEEELSSLLDGRKVILRTASEVSRYFREDVLREVAVLYVA